MTYTLAPGAVRKRYGTGERARLRWRPCSAHLREQKSSTPPWLWLPAAQAHPGRTAADAEWVFVAAEPPFAGRHRSKRWASFQA